MAPVMEEVPVSEEGPLRLATEEAARGLDWSVHLTGTGTRRWFEKAAEWGLLEALLESLRRARIVARGPKAAAVLRQFGLTPVWSPPGETSEEVKEGLLERVRPGERVAVQLYGEPVPGLTEALRGAGARVVEVAPYTWELPRSPQGRRAALSLVESLVRGDVQVLLVTSAPQARNLFILAGEAGLADELRAVLRDRVFVAAVGEVARAGLEVEGVEADLVASPPRLGSLLRAVAEARERVLAKNRRPGRARG